MSEQPDRNEEKMLADKSHWRYEKRRKGVTARRIDGWINLHIQEIIRLTYGSFDGIEKCAVEPLVFIETIDNDAWGKPRVAIIGTEGVGWKSDHDSGIISVPVGASNGFGYARPVELHRDVLMKFVTDEVVDLADWVRVFGDRLESNLWLWQEQALAPESAEV
jgi:hypothetical protein